MHQSDQPAIGAGEPAHHADGYRLVAATTAALLQKPAGCHPPGAAGGVDRQSRLGHGHRSRRSQAEPCTEGSRQQEQLANHSQTHLQPQLGSTDQGVLTTELTEQTTGSGASQRKVVQRTQLTDQGGITGHASCKIQQQQGVGSKRCCFERGIATDQPLRFPTAAQQAAGFELLLNARCLAQAVQEQQARAVLSQQCGEMGLQTRDIRGLLLAADASVTELHSPSRCRCGDDRLGEPFRQAAFDAGEQRGQLVGWPAIAAVQHGEHRFPLGLEGRQCIELNLGDVPIQHQQHEIGVHGHPSGKAGPGWAIDLIDPRCVHQVDALQAWDWLGPGSALLLPCAAMGHVRGHQRLAHEGVDQARLADTDPAEHGDAKPALLQSLELVVQRDESTA